MNSLEDRLRDAYRRAAETVRPEQVPAPRWARERAARHERAAWRKLAPVAAAAAVVAVAVGSAVVLPRVLGGTGTAPAPGASARGTGIASAPSTPATGTPAGPPPKFMVIASSAGWLQVQVAATGRVVATVPAPQPGLAWTAAAAVTDNTFVLAAESAKGPQPGASCYTVLYTLTLTAAGSPASLTPLDVPRISGSLWHDDLAASADGMVAYASLKGCLDNATTTIGLIDTASKQTKQWTVPTRWWINGGLALSADGRVLALSIPDSTPVPPGVWVLATDSAPGPIAKRARRVVTPSSKFELSPPVLISADGSTVYVVTNYAQTPRQRASSVAAYDVATGALLRIVRTGWHLLLEGMSADPGMDHAVVWSEYFAEPVEIDLATGHVYTPRASLPRGVTTDVAAW